MQFQIISPRREIIVNRSRALDGKRIPLRILSLQFKSRQAAGKNYRYTNQSLPASRKRGLAGAFVELYLVLLGPR